VQDIIGNQATKGMHVLARLAPQVVETGVWTDGERLTLIDTYPAVARESPAVQRVMRGFEESGVARPGREFPGIDRASPDEVDSLFCP